MKQMQIRIILQTHTNHRKIHQEKDDGTFVVYKYDELQRLEKNAIITLVSKIWNYRPTGKFHKDPKTYEKFLKDILRVCMNYVFK